MESNPRSSSDFNLDGALLGFCLCFRLHLLHYTTLLEWKSSHWSFQLYLQIFMRQHFQICNMGMRVSQNHLSIVRYYQWCNRERSKIGGKGPKWGLFGVLSSMKIPLESPILVQKEQNFLWTPQFYSSIEPMVRLQKL